MQINPTSSRADSAFGFYSGGNSDGGFFDAMQDAMDSVASGDNVTVDNAMADQALVESPYTRHTTDGVTYTLDEVCFTKNELEELREQLIKEGAPEETLRQFDVLAGQPDGATLAQVMASLMGRAGGKFSEDDAHAITSLLGQIDPSGTLAGDALAFMRDGNGEAALELIRNALGKMAADQGIDVDPATLAALGRGLGLNDGTIQNLVGQLGGNALHLNGDQFSGLLDPAASQFMTDAANVQKLEAALDKTLKGLISKARDRMAREKEATERESRRVQQSKILIDKTVQAQSRDVLDQTLAGQAAAEAGKAGNMVGQAGAEREEAAQLNARGRAKANLQGQKANVTEGSLAENVKAAMNAHAEAYGEAGDEKGFGDGQKGKNDAWTDLLGKMEIKAAPATTQSNASSFVYSMLQGNLNNQIMDMEAQQSQVMSQQLNRQLANQVEQGMLTAMRDGATRMDLQLHPAELGALSITLISRNGEVTAQLRSERTETAELLARQMDMIRVNLENQGLKVDKIEVQLQNQQDSSSSAFADLGDHNARQEEDARRQELARLRNLASLRSGENSSLAQGLHNVGQSARYAGNALHVVA